ncbi:hypothetical protein C8R46DRAFT_1061957 [Mycena filopes]|nr:hypothetical protein C8R46DRAFT_1061957 [Mycena filopes]
MVLISLALLSLFMPNNASVGATTHPTPATCGNVSDAVPLYAASQPTLFDNFYSTSLGQITAVVGSQGYTFQGTVARVFPTQEISTIPLFHLFQNVVIDSFYTTSATERATALQNGYIVGATDAYVYGSQICGSIPLYRLYDSAATEHLLTTDATVRARMIANGSWVDQGIVGYVLDANPTCA